MFIFFLLAVSLLIPNDVYAEAEKENAAKEFQHLKADFGMRVMRQ